LDFLSFLVIIISPQFDSARSPSECEHYLFSMCSDYTSNLRFTQEKYNESLENRSD